MLRFLTFLLAVHILLSSTGIAVYAHLCRTNGSAYALFQKPDTCITAQKAKVCCSKKKEAAVEIHSSSCCKEHSVYVKASTEQMGEMFAWDMPQWAGMQMLDLAVRPVSPKPLSNQKLIRFLQYDPPQLAPDIRVLIQSFIC